MFVKLMVHAAGPQEFYQVLIVEADCFEAARVALRAYLARLGKRLIGFDEAQTSEVLPETIRLARVAPNPEGVVAATGCIFFDPRAVS